MNTAATLDIKKTSASIRQIKKSKLRKTQPTPPEGFMTGDEFEKRVKERVTKFYRDNGLL
jgi:hypothetical protein